MVRRYYESLNDAICMSGGNLHLKAASVHTGSLEMKLRSLCRCYIKVTKMYKVLFVEGIFKKRETVLFVHNID